MTWTTKKKNLRAWHNTVHGQYQLLLLSFSIINGNISVSMLFIICFWKRSNNNYNNDNDKVYDIYVDLYLKIVFINLLEGYGWFFKHRILCYQIPRALLGNADTGLALSHCSFSYSFLPRLLSTQCSFRRGWSMQVFPTAVCWQGEGFFWISVILNVSQRQRRASSWSQLRVQFVEDFMFHCTAWLKRSLTSADHSCDERIVCPVTAWLKSVHDSFD